MDGQGPDHSLPVVREQSCRSRCECRRHYDAARDAADRPQRDRFAVGALRAKQYLIIDRDTKYSAQFQRLIQDSGTNVIRPPPMSPNLNAYAERFVRSIKDECLDRMIFVGQESLRRAVTEYMEHYHSERNHQGLENRLIIPRTEAKAVAPFFAMPDSAAH